MYIEFRDELTVDNVFSFLLLIFCLKRPLVRAEKHGRSRSCEEEALDDKSGGGGGKAPGLGLLAKVNQSSSPPTKAVCGGDDIVHNHT